MRRLLLLAVVGLAAALAPPALGAPPDPSVYTDTLTTENFVVHFTGEFDRTDRIIRQHAGELAANAEWALATFTSWGFPRPLDDGDGNGRIEIWVGAPAGPSSVAYAAALSAGATTPGLIVVGPAYARDPHVIAHEVFHLIQFAMFAEGRSWFYEATAEWAAFRLLGYPAPLPRHEPDNSIDCEGDQCGMDGYEAGGYSRWTFWQYLGERFGQNVVKEIWDDIAAHADPAYDGDDAVAAVLASKGTTLADVYNDYSLALLTGRFELTGLKGLLPIVYGTVETPAVNATLVPLRVAVNRLGTRFVQFKPPAQASGAPCHPATLALTVTLPAGVTSRPQFFWPSVVVDEAGKTTISGTPVSLAVSGTTATASVPWDTCSADVPAYLSLPNGSQTLDARTFVVAATLTVDTARVVSGKQPPAGVKVIGTVIAAPTEDPAPTLHLYAPDVLMVSSTAQRITLVLHSSGDGRLQTSFGGADLGTIRLRAGANRVSLRLPRPAARMVASRRAVLELTSLAPGASGWGTRVTQRVAFKPPAKTKPKATKRARP